MAGDPPLRVAIVGGGIAGLALAGALDPALVAATIHEAEPERSGIGGGIVLWADALRSLARLGLTTTLDACSEPAGGGAVRDLTGRPLVGMPDTGMRLLTRPDLLAALEAAVPSSVGRTTGEVTDPGSLDADLVIGADGVRSRVRPLVWPAAADRMPTPWVALRGIASTPVAADDVGEYWGAGLLFGVMRLDADRTYWFTSHHGDLGPEPLDPAAVAVQVRPRVALGGAAPVLARLLESVDETTLATRLWATSMMPRYVHGRYVVLGDAAHAMTPNLGRGACEAILDAVTLGETLNAAVRRRLVGGSGPFHGGDTMRSRSRHGIAEALSWGSPSRAGHAARPRPTRAPSSLAPLDGALLRWQLGRVPRTQVVRIASSVVMRVALTTRHERSRDRILRLGGRVSR